MREKLLPVLMLLLLPAPGRAQVTAAEEAYREAESHFHIYMETGITAAQPRKMQKQLKDKTRMLQELEQAYLEIIKLEEPVFAIASYYKLGLANENLAEALKRMPVPGKLTPEQVKIYRAELENMAESFEQKALEYFRTAVRKAKKLGVSTDHARLAKERQKELAKELEKKLKKKLEKKRKPVESPAD